MTDAYLAAHYLKQSQWVPYLPFYSDTSLTPHLCDDQSKQNSVGLYWYVMTWEAKSFLLQIEAPIDEKLILNQTITRTSAGQVL